jgi:hypothetical protein
MSQGNTVYPVHLEDFRDNRESELSHHGFDFDW